MLSAFIDESARRRVGESACVYTLAAVIVSDTSLDEVRAAMRGLRYGRTPRVHWRLERPDRQSIIAKTVAELPMTGVVAVYLHDVGVKTERARRLCMVRLLTELSRMGVDAVTFESRGAQDRDDRAVLTGLRRSAFVRADVAVTWLAAHHEPVLWTADVVAGSVSWWLNGDDRYWASLEAVTRVLDVDP